MHLRGFERVAASEYACKPQAAWQRRLLYSPIKEAVSGISIMTSKRSKQPSTCPSPMPSSCSLLLVEDVAFESAATPQRKVHDSTHPKISKVQNEKFRHPHSPIIHWEGAPLASARPYGSSLGTGRTAGQAGNRTWRGPCDMCMCRGQRLKNTDRKNIQPIFHHPIMEVACDSGRDRPTRLRPS